MSLLFKYNDFFIEVTDNVLEIINSYKQTGRNSHESGGILFGSIDPSNNNFVIQKASLPSKYDKSSRTTFERNKEIAQVLIDYEFTNSQGTRIYLGEWHTHPEPNPTPSGQDLKMILEQFKNNKINAKHIFLLIAGYESVYVGIVENQKLIRLNPVSND